MHWAALALLGTARDGVAGNVDVVVMVFPLLMLLAAKMCLDRSERMVCVMMVRLDAECSDDVCSALGVS